MKSPSGFAPFTTLTVELKNVGSTPARETKNRGKVFVQHDEPPEDVNVNLESTSSGFLAQGASMIYPHTYTFDSPDQFAAFMAGALRFTFVGEIEYRDVFATRYLNRYCLTWQRDTQQFSICDRNNRERVLDRRPTDSEGAEQR